MIKVNCIIKVDKYKQLSGRAIDPRLKALEFPVSFFYFVQ